MRVPVAFRAREGVGMGDIEVDGAWVESKEMGGTQVECLRRVVEVYNCLRMCCKGRGSLDVAMHPAVPVDVVQGAAAVAQPLY